MRNKSSVEEDDDTEDVEKNVISDNDSCDMEWDELDEWE
jgi:hypothetical protein